MYSDIFMFCLMENAMTTRQELEKMVEDGLKNYLGIHYGTPSQSVFTAESAFKSGAAFVMDKLMPEIERLKYEGEKDYEGMREFQKKFINSNQELTAANERIKELEALPPPERGEE